MNTRLTAAVLALALLATGCTTAVIGDSLSKVDKPVVLIPEEPAKWAAGRIDPCTLLTAAVPLTITPGSAYLVRPHRCEMEVTKDSWDKFTVELEVGARFHHGDRADSAPVTARGLLAYQRLSISEMTSNTCEVFLPLSSTAAILVTSRAEGRERDPGIACATPRGFVDRVAGELERPEAHLHRPGPMLAKWDMCEVLGGALDRPAPEPGRNRDECSARLDSGKYISLAAQHGDDPAVRVEAPETIVQLNGVAAKRHRFDSSEPLACTLSWAQEAVPISRYGNSFHVLQLSGAACEEFPALANKVRAVLSAEPPGAPAPGRLGLPDGAQDEETDPACRIFTNAWPDTCRAAKPAIPRQGVNAIMAAVGESSGGDELCAMLADAMRTVTLREPVVAVVDDIHKWGCAARTPDYSLAVNLGVGPDESLTGLADWLCLTGSRWGDGTVDGRQARNCTHHGGVRTVAGVTGKDVYVAVRGSAEAEGILKITGSLHHPVGISDILRPAQDAEKAALVDRVAEHVARRYFTS
ncbi:hypothetical protein [Allokutzneria albata]|uniref:Uncharacterized protein n=1 Tax=Allokutzneria albata TaxID=211114 RepID=A0A1H0BB47_ALLAB|nr:hypothetical protein [Allokutzneria albata]SDN42872.1 hypothetical protein SAMN04489726_6575 [Allokutzneria albata]